MNNEQKQRARTLTKALSQVHEFESRLELLTAAELAVDMSILLQELIEQPASVPDGWWRLIHDTLRNYRMSTLVDEDGDGYLLIDAMTADSQPVSGGIEECTYLADAIWNALLAAAPAAPAAPERDQWEPANVPRNSAIHSDPDAATWAKYFVTVFPGLADKEDLMRGWFANAMMAMYDHLHQLGKIAPTAPEQNGVAMYAERYRWLRTYNTAKHPAVTEAFFLGDENLDAAIDAARAAEKGGQP